MRLLFPKALIVAFEPIPTTFEALKRNFENDSLYKAINCGLGSSTGTLQFHQNEYSPSSSFLKMTETHQNSFEHAVNQQQITVQIQTLDAFIKDMKLELPLLIKMDVQGYEAEVIAGGRQTLSNAAMIISEVSFKPLYQQQPLFNDIYQLLTALGFAYAGSTDQLRSPQNNEILQADGIFVKQ